MPRTSAALKKDADTATTTAKVKPAAKSAAKPGTALATRATGAVVDAAAIREQLRKQAAAMSERTAPVGGSKIQVGQDKMLKLPDGSKVASIEAVIVDFVSVHNYYEGSYDPKNIQPPGCFAVGNNPKDMTPVAESPNRQAESCQVCPMNEFGSNGDGKACKNGRRLAVLPVNEAGDDVDADADILLIDVSPTAIKGFDSFVQTLARVHQMPPIGFVTTIQCDPNSDYAKLTFSDPRAITPQGTADAMGRQEEAKDMLNQKPDFSGWVAVAPAGRGAKPAAKAGARR